ncbi:MAG TPA: YbhB/YbcL family Raf kinase inhibitor-like protein [Acidobacteriaceae bacterium]|nr:YbhB/YbcL family Raf kinase inhibitor-like protein [Acidobacteriaceae bacterium]
MELKSQAYRAGGSIPVRYTCDGISVSLPLSWRGVPTGAHSLALTLHDPDAPRRGGFTHWVMYNINPRLKSLPEGIPLRDRVGVSALQGANDAGRIGYFGPCPPSGTHRYVLTLFALNTVLKLKPGASQPQLMAAMKGHVLATAVLIGTYSRK